MSAKMLRLLLSAALLGLSAPVALAAEEHGHKEPAKEEKPVPKLSESLSGKTFSFNANVTFDQPVVLERGKGAQSIGSQHAIVFLDAGGAARVRRWNEVTGLYEAVEAGRWTIDDGESTLCVAVAWPVLKRDRFCMQLRVSGAVVAGHGTNVRALVLGDVRPGNPDAL